MNNKLLVELEDMIRQHGWSEVLAHMDYLSDTLCEATTTVGHFMAMEEDEPSIPLTHVSTTIH
jgi:hypothetical protein